MRIDIVFCPGKHKPVRGTRIPTISLTLCESGCAHNGRCQEAPLAFSSLLKS